MEEGQSFSSVCFCGASIPILILLKTVKKIHYFLGFMGINDAWVLVYGTHRTQSTILNLVVSRSTELFLDDRILQSAGEFCHPFVTLPITKVSVTRRSFCKYCFFSYFSLLFCLGIFDCYASRNNTCSQRMGFG